MGYATAAKQYGTVTYEGVEYALCQQAYCDNYGTDNQVRYHATAIDIDGNQYKVTWETIEFDCGELPEDESDACDWDNPISVDLI